VRIFLSYGHDDYASLAFLARAYELNLPIIPVMVSTVKPPLSICRLQWLDMRNSFPPEQHEEHYSKLFAQLEKALAEKQRWLDVGLFGNARTVSSGGVSKESRAQGIFVKPPRH
jgi:hypothetical protein